jgi:hypothetical protein
MHSGTLRWIKKIIVLAIVCLKLLRNHTKYLRIVCMYAEIRNRRLPNTVRRCILFNKAVDCWYYAESLTQWMSIEHWQNDTDGGKPTCSDKKHITAPPCPPQIPLWLIPRLRGKRLTINRLLEVQCKEVKKYSKFISVNSVVNWTTCFGLLGGHHQIQQVLAIAD